MNRKEYSRKYYQENKERLKELRKQCRLAHIDEYRASDRRAREKYKEYRREYERLRRRRVRLVVLTYYGRGKAACVICGEARLACLSIDHINNDGARHKREIGYSSGSSFYRWLKSNNYPEGFQTLCMNCQFAKKAESK